MNALNKLFFNILVFIFINVNIAYSQSSFYAFYGDQNQTDQGVKCIQTFDNNFVVIGYTNSPSFGADGIVLKVNTAGDTIWTRVISDTALHNQIFGVFISQLSDSGFIMSYTITDQNCNDFILLIRLNVNGDIVWTKRYSLFNEKTDYIFSIRQTHDGNFIAAGNSDRSSIVNNTEMSGLILKLNSSGDTIWTRAIRNYYYTYFIDIKETPDFNYIVTGFSQDSLNHSYPNLMKLDPAGNIIWIKNYDFPNICQSFGVEITTDGFLIFGNTYINPSQRNFLMKTDTSGNILWCNIYDLAPFIGGARTLLTPCITGGYYLSDNIADSTMINHILLLKIDDNGIPLWSKIYGGKPIAGVSGIYGTSDGGCLLTGVYADTLLDFPVIWPDEEDLLIMKTESNGNVNCNQSISMVSFSTLTVPEITFPIYVSSGINQYPNPLYINSGYPSSSLCSSVGISIQNETQNPPIVFPNPFSDKINITTETNEPLEITLFDVTSRKIFNQSFTNSTSINTSYLSKGIYIYELRNKNGVIKKGKVVKSHPLY